MPDDPPAFSDFKRVPLPTVCEGIGVVGLWAAAIAIHGWAAIVLMVVATLLTIHLVITVILLINAARAIQQYQAYEVERRAGKHPRRG